MKALVYLIFIFILFNSTVYGQDSTKALPESFVNIGLGAGVNYGIIGTKIVLGYKNSGVLIGLGVTPDGFAGYQVGGQFSIKSFYTNIGYGVIGSYQINNEKPKAVEAANVLVGIMISLGKARAAFIDLGIGHSFGATKIKSPMGEVDLNHITAVIGIGYRLGGK